MPIDISVVVPVHDEGRLAHPTLQSLFRAVRVAGQRGIASEILVVLDTPTADTSRFMRRFQEEVRLVTVSCADPGLSRNHGVRAARGKYVFFLDADDLFGGNWLGRGFEHLEQQTGDCIVHTEYCMVFDGYSSFWRKISSDSPEFSVAGLLENNCWDIGCGARRELLLEYPFQPTPRAGGFGFEDWHLYCDTLADGIVQHVVPETVYFARRKKSGSQLAASNAAHHLLRRSKLFSTALFPPFFHRTGRLTP